MKLNNKGWGYRMMAFLMFILIAFLLVAIHFIYLFYSNIDLKQYKTPNSNQIIGETL